MAEEEGFEPPRALTPLSVFKTDPFSRTWVFLRIGQKLIYHISEVDVNNLIKNFLGPGFIENPGHAFLPLLWSDNFLIAHIRT